LAEEKPLTKHKKPKLSFVAEWAFICFRAFFDDDHQLFVERLVRRFNVPKLGIAFTEFTIVTVLKTRPREGENVNINLDILTPSGTHCNPQDPNAVRIECGNDFLLLTLKEMPILEEGTYRFNIRVNGLPLTTVEMPVRVLPSAPDVVH
jgi:hypothetical protein